MERELEDRAAAYNDIGALKITKNNERLKSLGVSPLVAEMAEMHQTRPVEKQRKKRSLDETIPESDRVLRQRSIVRHESTDRKKVVGGRELGTECCEVVVDYIMKRDAILPRPVGNVTTIGQAQGRTIAWLYKHIELQKSMTKQASPPQEE